MKSVTNNFYQLSQSPRNEAIIQPKWVWVFISDSPDTATRHNQAQLVCCLPLYMSRCRVTSAAVVVLVCRPRKHVISSAGCYFQYQLVQYNVVEILQKKERNQSVTSKVLYRLIEKIFSVIEFHVNGIYKMVYINILYSYSLLENMSV